MVELIAALSGAPLHVILILMVYFLWRRVTVLEDRLEKCLRQSAKK